MDAVEAGGEVEDRAERRGRQRHAVVDELGVLIRLAGHEDRAEDEGQGVPLDHPPAGDVEDRAVAALARGERLAPGEAALGQEDADLAGDGAQHQDRGVQQCVAVGEVRLAFGEGFRRHGAQGEVHREQTAEEHQLAGEPDDRADLRRIGTTYRWGSS
eukprot:Nk52_evm1s1708 gene=Nk52_evmTU1s1708